MPDSLPDYIAIKQHLATATEGVWGIARLFEHWLPHDAPSDAEWPAPENYAEICDLLDRLAPPRRVFCGVTAVRMILPDFGPHIFNWRSALLRAKAFIPEIHVQQIEEWAGSDSRIADAGVLANDIGRWVRMLGLAERLPAPLQMAYSALDSLVHAILGPEQSSTHAADAVAYSANAATGLPMTFLAPSPKAFFAAWWVRCRCRLAFADAPTAALLPVSAADSDD